MRRSVEQSTDRIESTRSRSLLNKGQGASRQSWLQ
jgi:hypothetical protein